MIGMNTTQFKEKVEKAKSKYARMYGYKFPNSKTTTKFVKDNYPNMRVEESFAVTRFFDKENRQVFVFSRGDNVRYFADWAVSQEGKN
jgi:hypothetical protein